MSAAKAAYGRTDCVLTTFCQYPQQCQQEGRCVAVKRPDKPATPIADAFAHNRAVLPDAMALIRQLERSRALMLSDLVKLTRNADWLKKYDLRNF